MAIEEILSGILIFAGVGLLRGWRVGLLFFISVMGVFLLQPKSPLADVGRILPTLSLILVSLTWLIVSHDIPNRLLVIGIPIGVTILVFGESHVLAKPDLLMRKRFAGLLIVIMMVGLLLLKIPAAVVFLSQLMRASTGLEIRTAQFSDIQWIGISYLVLRLTAVLIDFRQDRLPELSLPEMLIYALFPAALLAGPIDRAERFAADLRARHPLDAPRLLDAGQRIGMGLFKKFLLADSLALVALSPAIAPDVKNTTGAWLVVYLYAFQLYLDFSGYTDIAIGVGKLAGIDLPENFNAPYLQQNLSRFWQNWHMSLTDWFRSYCFLPLTRWLLRRRLPISNYLVGQIVTMTLIGLWHGVTINFVLWGLWHAFGLYGHRLLAASTRTWYLSIQERVWIRQLSYVSGVVLTFHYVVIGWVFFALPDPAMSFDYLKRMFGLA